MNANNTGQKPPRKKKNMYERLQSRTRGNKGTTKNKVRPNKSRKR